MKWFFSNFRLIKWVLAAVLLALIGFGIFRIHSTESTPTATAQVDRGTLEQLVSVSGTVKLTNTAELSFTQSGIVSHLLVDEGSVVSQGQILASLEQQKLDADLHDAEAYIAIQTANRDELQNGPSTAERNVTAADVAEAKNTLDRTIREQDELVRTAQRTLFSTDIEAVPENKNTSATPPLISGIYTCENEGFYSLRMYAAGSESGYAFALSGESVGTYVAYTNTAQAFGSCGLFIQFADDVSYGNQVWTIDIPNKRSSAYVTNLNAYELAVEKRKNTIAAAKESYGQAVLAEAEKNSIPRDEAIRRANANIEQARARYEALRAEKTQRTIVAPFPGTISNVTLTTGESSGTGSITLVSDRGFELSVRIPEIDITKITLGDTARIMLDARPEEVLTAKVSFISPVATEIDGVSYYEALLYFETTPDWLRGGFNADVDIITDSLSNVLRLPERFVGKAADGTRFVTIMNGKKTETRTIETGFAGNDGFIEVKNLPEGFEVLAL